MAKPGIDHLFDMSGILGANAGSWRAVIILLLHLGIASWVTLHALLHKRDVGATLGWIGLAWLSPFLGGFFYFVLGINRVKRRARRLKVARPIRTASSDRDIVGRPGARPQGEPVPDERADGPDEDGVPRAERKTVSVRPAPSTRLESALVQAIDSITGRSLETGNSVDIFQNGDEAYPAMLDAIAGAKVSIGLSSYIFRTDRTGRRFIDALAAARQRGVAVCVIVDGVGGGYILSPAFHALRHAGIPVGRFMHSPLPWRMPLLNLRSHKKILVVDGTIGFTGGMNIADENVMALKPKNPVQDTHFRLRGPVVTQLTGAFASDWSFVTDDDLDDAAWFPKVAEAGTSAARIVTSGPDRDVEKMEFAALQAITCAHGSIHIMTPYFLPDDLLVTALALAAMRGVAVDVVLPQASNHRLVDWATRATVAPLLLAGVRLWQGPPPFRHSKIMVVDGEWSLIGSSNWDMRSFRLNFELCTEVYDTVLARALCNVVMANKGVPLTLGMLDARSLPVRLRDAAVRLMMPYL